MISNLQSDTDGMDFCSLKNSQRITWNQSDPLALVF